MVIAKGPVYVPEFKNTEEFASGWTLPVMLGPNITGSAQTLADGSVFHKTGKYSGALSLQNPNLSWAYQSYGSQGSGALSFDASKSNPLFKNGTTVQPASVTSLILIKI